MIDWASISGIGYDQVSLFMRYWFQGTGATLGLVLAAEIILRAANWWAHRKDEVPRALMPKDAPANFVLSLHALAIDFGFGNAAILAGLWFGSRLTHWHIPFNLYTLPLYFLAAEFWHYIYHRMGHEVRVLWADHSIHHSSRDYEFFTSWRLTPFTWAYKWFTAIPMALLGFGPLPFLLMAKGISFQTFIHTRRIGSMGWFDKWFVSPTNHSIHHACNPQYIDKNYGGMTMIFDQLLGTFILPGEEKIKFGITKDVNSHDPFKIWAFEFRHLLVDFWHAPGLAAKMKVMFGKPGETYVHATDSKTGRTGPGDLGLDPALVAAE